MLASEENLLGLMALNRELVGQAEAFDDSERVVLDMDSTESPVHGQQEGSAYNGHFESVCYHPLLLFNGHGDCLAAKLRPGNVHSAEDWCAGSAGTGERALRVSVDAALRAGIFKASGSIDPIGFGDERERGLPRPWSSSR